MNNRRRSSFPLTTLVLWMLAAGVLAADDDNWNAKGLNSGLLMCAALYNLPCHLSRDFAEQEIVKERRPVASVRAVPHIGLEYEP